MMDTAQRNKHPLKGNVMQKRTTPNDITAAFDRLTAAARSLGIDTSEFRLHLGNTSTGISWKLDMPGHSLRMGFGGNYLGSTARQAYDALEYMTRAWEIAAEVTAAKPTN